MTDERKKDLEKDDFEARKQKALEIEEWRKERLNQMKNERSHGQTVERNRQHKI